MVQERVKFHSANDLSTCWYLQKIETFFLNWHKHICAPDVNTILELFNIKNTQIQAFDSYTGAINRSANISTKGK